RDGLSALPPLPLLPAAPAFLGGVPLAATCLPLLGGAAFLPEEDLGGAFLAEGAACLAEALLPEPALGAGAFFACCALQAADLALVLQGSEVLAACAAGGRSAHTASAAGAMAFAIARFQEKAMVEQACRSVNKYFLSRRIRRIRKSPDELWAYASNLNSNFKLRARRFAIKTQKYKSDGLTSSN
ncbi:hypothetical protein, partial [Achromobacter arsenitoxydans]|uniref:hypothetical protein n=1 Tax=Achromobacter arsenitoxydans TaxID=1147684 RepID=UPI001EE64381